MRLAIGWGWISQAIDQADLAEDYYLANWADQLAF